MTPEQLQHFSNIAIAASAVLAFALGYIGGYLT